MRLDAKNISYGYNKKRLIFDNFNLNITSNERLGITAPSGYGKTTLAKLLSGYELPTDGEILLDDKLINKNTFNPIQLILQHPEKAVNPRWKMKKVLDEAGAKDPNILSSLGIEKQWLQRYPTELSSGELQRFCVARALAVDIKFLIADEITAMLDVITQAQIWNYILSVTKQRQIGLIVISHNKPLINKLCTRVINLADHMHDK